MDIGSTLCGPLSNAAVPKPILINSVPAISAKRVKEIAEHELETETEDEEEIEIAELNGERRPPKKYRKVQRESPKDTEPKTSQQRPTDIQVDSTEGDCKRIDFGNLGKDIFIL